MESTIKHFGNGMQYHSLVQIHDMFITACDFWTDTEPHEHPTHGGSYVNHHATT
jgi:hypothetical protein